MITNFWWVFLIAIWQDSFLIISNSRPNKFVARKLCNNKVIWQDGTVFSMTVILWQESYLLQISLLTRCFCEGTIGRKMNKFMFVTKRICICYNEDLYLLGGAFPAIRPTLHLPSWCDRAGAPRHLQWRLLVYYFYNRFWAYRWKLAINPGHLNTFLLPRSCRKIFQKFAKIQFRTGYS